MQGTMFMLAAGNDGYDGPFAASGAADGIGVTAVGSVDNIVYPTYAIGANYTGLDGSPQPFRWQPTYPVNISTGSYPVYAVATSPDDYLAGCQAYPDGLDLSPYIVLVAKGTCPSTGKVAHAVAAGARYVFLINDGPGTFGSSGPGLDALGVINHETGVGILAAIHAGIKVEMQIESPATAKYELQNIPNHLTDAKMSYFTTWGPTFEAWSVPTVSAPGGYILSTFPRIYNNYTSLSGTSMATPFLAGVAALVTQARGRLPVPTLRALLASNTTPLRYSDGFSVTYPYLAPLIQQGGGLIDAYAAVYATTLLNASMLNFNDTKHLAPGVFTVTNNGTRPATYVLSNIGAATVYTLDEGKSVPINYNQTSHPETLTTYVDLSISPDHLTLQPGQSATVRVVPEIPITFDQSRIPVYSGFVAINSTDDPHNRVTLPYMGIASSLYDAKQIDQSLGYPYISAANDTNATNLTAGGAVPVFTVPVTNLTVDPSTLALPSASFVLSMGTYLINIGIGAVTGNSTSGTVQYKEVGMAINNENPIWTRIYLVTLPWTGRFDDGRLADEGRYVLLMKTLRLTGDPNNPDDYEVVPTPPFELRHEKS